MSVNNDPVIQSAVLTGGPVESGGTWYIPRNKAFQGVVTWEGGSAPHFVRALMLRSGTVIHDIRKKVNAKTWTFNVPALDFAGEGTIQVVVTRPGYDTRILNYQIGAPPGGPAPTPSPGQLFDSLHISERRYSSSTGAKFIEFTVQTLLGGSGAPVANVQVDLSFDGQTDQVPGTTNAAGIQVFARLEHTFTPGPHRVMAYVITDPPTSTRISNLLDFTISQDDGGGGDGEDPGPGPGPGPSPFPSLTGLQLAGIPIFIGGLAMVWPENREKVKRKFRKTVHAMKQTSKASKKELARALRILRGRR